MRQAWVALAAVALVVSVAVALGVAHRRHAEAPAIPTCAACCELPATARAEPMVPDKPGQPCLLAFQIPGSAAALKMSPALQQLREVEKGRLVVLVVDPQTHTALAARWRLRIAHTQVLVSAEGTELWRHEGQLDASQLKAKIDKALP